MKLGPQALDLLQVAEDYRAEQCQSLLAKATAESHAILKRAQVQARLHLRSVLAPERERLVAEIAIREAQLVTQRRWRDQRRVASILSQAWPRLVHALRQRWDTPSSRTAWVMHHLSIALMALPAKGWVIQHPDNWPAPERERAHAWLQTRGIAGASFEADAQLPAGIRVVCGLNLLDASLDGLLTDGTEIEGRLLYHLAQQP